MMLRGSARLCSEQVHRPSVGTVKNFCREKKRREKKRECIYTGRKGRHLTGRFATAIKYFETSLQRGDGKEERWIGLMKDTTHNKAMWTRTLRRIRRRIKKNLQEQGLDDLPSNFTPDVLGILRMLGPCPGGIKYGKQWYLLNLIPPSLLDLREPEDCEVAFSPLNYRWAKAGEVARHEAMVEELGSARTLGLIVRKYNRFLVKRCLASLDDEASNFVCQDDEPLILIGRKEKS